MNYKHNKLEIESMSKLIKSSYALQQMLKLQMSDNNAVSMCQYIKVASQDAGKVIVPRGADVDNWYFIINGLVSACLQNDAGSSTSITLYGSGTWFGEYSIINQKPSFCDYITLQDCDFLVMPGRLMNELAKVDVGFSFFLVRMLAWRSQYAGEMLTLMKAGSPPLRVMIGLSQIVEALAYHNERPPTIGYGDGLKIPLNQTILANLCGVSRSVFSEVIQHLVKNNIISILYGELEIISIRAWGLFASRKRTERIYNLNPSVDQLVREFSCLV